MGSLSRDCVERTAKTDSQPGSVTQASHLTALPELDLPNVVGQAIANSAHWASMLDFIPDGILVVDEDGLVQFENQSAGDHYGVRVGDNTRETLGVACNSGDVVEIEIEQPDGRSITAEIRSQPLRETGDTSQLLWLRDITDRKLMEAELAALYERLRQLDSESAAPGELQSTSLREAFSDQKYIERELFESEERFRIAFEHGSIGKVLFGHDMRLLRVNRAMAQMFECPAVELMSNSLLERVHPDDLEFASRHFEKLFLGEIPNRTIEVRCHTCCGGTIDVELTTNVVQPFDGPPCYGLALLENVTERRRSRELARRQERLAAIGTIATSIAHEINNPVGASLLAAETALALVESKGLSEVEVCLYSIIRAMDRCGRITRNTLRFSQESTGTKARCRINEIIHQAHDLMRDEIDRRQATVQLSLQEGLPAVFLNELEWELVLVNLLKNSIESRHSPVRVEVSSAIRDGFITVTILDDGPGICGEHVDRVFDPFFTTKTGEGGTGLGLSIVHRVVQEHGGTIELKSVPDQGTRITIRLPAL